MQQQTPLGMVLRSSMGASGAALHMVGLFGLLFIQFFDAWGTIYLPIIAITAILVGAVLFVIAARMAAKNVQQENINKGEEE
ncbi:MAG: hypothetical protein FWE38_01430 [Firmicutes bacterium]|nr:hypothetical protein [Bacillota bacterium]